MSTTLPRTGTSRPTRQAAGYKALGGRERCGLCRHYVPDGQCNRITGAITANGWCRYFSQELAASIYQPQGAIGTGGGASLDLSFIDGSGTLDPRITFTRASTGTYTDDGDIMRTAAINVPRFDYDPVTHAALGLLIEEARTNLALQSANLANAAWLVANITAAAPVVTANQTTAPDGTLTAARVVYPAVSGAGNASLVFQGVIVTAAAYTFSAYMRGNAGGERLYILAENSGATVFYKTQVTLTTAWQRVSVTTPALTAASWNFVMGCDLRDGTQTATAAQTVFVWGGQLEQGAFPTSYIPTTAAAVTRSADLCSIQPAQMGFYTPPGGSWQAELISNVTAGWDYNRIIYQLPAVTAFSPMITDAGRHASQYDGSGPFATTNIYTPGAVMKIATTATAIAGQLCLNGGVVAATAGGGGYPALASSGVGFMCDNVINQYHTNGYLRRVRYWPRVLSNAELQSVTT